MIKKTLICAISAVFLLFSSVFVFGAENSSTNILPKLEEKYRLFNGECDGGKTQSRIYVIANSIFVEEVIMSSGNKSYFEVLRPGDKFYFWQENGSKEPPQLLSSSEWLERVKKESLNYFRFKSVPVESNDCHAVKEGAYI